MTTEYRVLGRPAEAAAPQQRVVALWRDLGDVQTNKPAARLAEWTSRSAVAVEWRREPGEIGRQLPRHHDLPPWRAELGFGPEDRLVQVARECAWIDAQLVRQQVLTW